MYYLILFVGKHPFLNPNGTMNYKKQGNGQYEKDMEGKYSSELVELMERMMHVV
jgi:hypothetical protein